MSTDTPKTSKIPWIDVILVGLGIGLLIYYGMWIYSHRGAHAIDWGAVFLFLIAGATLLVGGYYCVRKAESHQGEFSIGEALGVLFFGCGLVLITIGALPEAVIDSLRDKARALKPLQEFEPPLMRVIDATDWKTLDISRIGQIEGSDTALKTLNKDETKVFVAIELDPAVAGENLTATPKVPLDAHGKVWFEVKGRKSRAQDF
jgi:hypothetical protein